jgi:DNA-binding transcriptional LysR family regulator
MLRAFLRVVQLSSFSRAAEAMETTSPTISKLVAQLEEHLGARLLQRSTRKMSVTEAGRIYYEYCVRILDELDAGQQAVQHLFDAPRGTLRISVPTSFGIMSVSPLLPEFMRQYPEIRLDIVANDRYVDLFEEGFDLSLRISRHLPDSSLVAKPLGKIPHVVVASPQYLKRIGKPKTPDDLERHNCLIYTLSPTPGEWLFSVRGILETVRVKGRLQSNNSVMLRAALLEGAGIARIPRVVVEDLLRSGLLVECLEKFAPPPHQLFAMLPQRRTISPKVRAFVEFMARHHSE